MTKMYLMSFYFMMMIIQIIAMISLSFSLNNKYSHPMILMMILITYSLLLSMNLSIYFNNHWFSFIMFLTIISGLMILFMYFMSFINNMKMLINKNQFKIQIMLNLMFILIMIKFFYNEFNWFKTNEILSLKILMNSNYLKNFMSINFMYSYNKNLMTIISMIYLFICLTLIAKICLNKKYSIRKIN